MKQKYLITGLMVAIFAGGITCLTSCDDDLVINKAIDESAYTGIYENNGYLRDGKSNLSSNVVDLYKDTYTTSVKMSLSKMASTSTSAQVIIDADYLDTYNKEHETDFELYPAHLVSFKNDGKLIVDAQTKSVQTDITIQADGTLKEDKTYALPIALTHVSSDITIKDEKAGHCIYLIKDMRKLGNTYKGEDVVKSFVFFDGTNPLNALSFQLENGKLLWDVVSPFAANINWDAQAQRPYLKCNAYIQYLLDNNEKFLQPLRKRGTKIVLGILSNGDITGVAQLSKQGAKDFARELAQYCKAYNLDGVCFDDEYEGAYDPNNPALTKPSEEAAARLCYETKQAMPDKIVAVYALRRMYSSKATVVDGVTIKNWIDIVVGDYGRDPSQVPYGDLTSKECSGQSMEFVRGTGGDLQGQRLINQGSGWFMGFSPKPENYGNVFRRLSDVKTLYGSPLQAPTVFYKDNDATPYQYPDDLQ